MPDALLSRKQAVKEVCTKDRIDMLLLKYAKVTKGCRSRFDRINQKPFPPSRNGFRIDPAPKRHTHWNQLRHAKVLEYVFVTKASTS